MAPRFINSSLQSLSVRISVSGVWQVGRSSTRAEESSLNRLGRQQQQLSAAMKGANLRNLLVGAIHACALLRATDALWHAYDADKKYDPSCNTNTAEEFAAEFKKHTRPISEENRMKWGLFADVMSASDMRGMGNGETMYGFEAGMEAIWENQHPADCSTAKYLVSGAGKYFESGFGHELHVVGTGLALAMTLNRVYIMIPSAGKSGIDKWNPANRWQVDTRIADKFNSVNRWQVDTLSQSYTTLPHTLIP
jgi:hypothetical protein